MTPLEIIGELARTKGGTLLCFCLLVVFLAFAAPAVGILAYEAIPVMP